MSAHEDLMTRLGALAREQERKVRIEQLAPSLTPRDPAALRDAIVADALDALQKRAGTQPNEAPERSTSALPWGIVGALAVAAAVLFVFIGQSQTVLPHYALRYDGFVRVQRGEDEGQVAALSSRSELVLSLRPAQDVSGDVALELFVARDDGLSKLDVPIERAPSGAFRVRVRAREALGEHPQALSFVALVCRPDACSAARHLLLEPRARGDGFQILRVSATYRP